MKKIVNSLLVLVVGIGMVAGGIVDVGAETESPKSTTANVKFEPGELTLNSVTENLNFGANKLDGVNNTYKAVGLKEGSLFNVTLTDARGLGHTWTLTAQLSDFKIKGVSTLEGAKISFKEGEAESIHNPQAKAVSDSLELMSGVDASTVEVFKADSENNTGKWNFKWNEIELFVPVETAQAGEHTATIEWTLADVPGATEN